MVVPESHTKLSHNAKLILETKKFAPKEMFFPIIISNSAKRIAFHFRREEIGIGDKGRRTHYLPVVDTNRMRRNETFLYREGKKKDRNSLVQDKKGHLQNRLCAAH